jgi:hypothetical protein
MTPYPVPLVYKNEPEGEMMPLLSFSTIQGLKGSQHCWDA